MLGDDVAYLLEDFGSNLTLTRDVGGTYSPATGTYTDGTPTTFTIRGVFINYRDDRVDGSVIQMSDRQLLVSADGSETTPAIGDKVGGLQLIDVRAFAPNGTAIAWSCQARK